MYKIRIFTMYHMQWFISPIMENIEYTEQSTTTTCDYIARHIVFRKGPGFQYFYDSSLFSHITKRPRDS